MTGSTSAAPINERPTHALRLLFGAQLAWMFWGLFSEQLTHLYRSFMGVSNSRLPPSLDVVLALPTAVLFIALALGLVRFVASPGEVWARRWGYSAAILFGVWAVWFLCLRALPVAGVELRSLGSSLTLVSGSLAAGSLAAMLLTLWKGSLALDVHPPKGLIRFAMGAVVLQWVYRLVSQYFVDSFGFSAPRFFISEVLPVLNFLVHVLLLGVLGVTLAQVERKRDGAAVGSEWTQAAEGLGLYIKGLRVRIALLILFAALPVVLSDSSAYRAIDDNVQGLIVLVGLVFSGMMLVGLSRYASQPDMGGSRGYVYASLVLLMCAEKVAMRPHMRWQAYVVLAVLPLSFLLLSVSFRWVAQQLQAVELAQAARQVALLLFVPGSVSSVFRFLDAPQGFSSLLSFVALVCVMVGVVRFFLLLGRVRRRMLEGVAPASPQVALFSGV